MKTELLTSELLSDSGYVVPFLISCILLYGNTILVNCHVLSISHVYGALLHAGKLLNGRQKHRYLPQTLAASRKFWETFR